MRSSDLGPKLILAALLVSVFMWELPNIFAHLLTVLLVAAGVAFALMVGYLVYWMIRNRTAPVVRKPATVIRKRTRDWDVTLTGETPEMAAARLGMMGRHPHEAAKAYNRSLASPDVPEMQLASGADFFITFDISGRETELLVPKETYVALEEGKQGLLVFQGEQFKHFIPLDVSDQRF